MDASSKSLTTAGASSGCGEIVCCPRSFWYPNGAHVGHLPSWLSGRSSSRLPRRGCPRSSGPSHYDAVNQLLMGARLLRQDLALLHEMKFEPHRGDVEHHVVLEVAVDAVGLLDEDKPNLGRCSTGGPLPRPRRSLRLVRQSRREWLCSFDAPMRPRGTCRLGALLWLREAQSAVAERVPRVERAAHAGATLL